MMTGEESIDQLEQFAMQGGRGAFFFLRWLHRRRKAKKAEQPIHEADHLMNDACSRYRGGYYNPANEKATEGMMSDLSGGKASTSEPFVFMGDKSDLSVFWQVVTPETQNRFRKSPEVRVSVPRSMIDEIPDEKIRAKVLSVFTKARADALLQYDGRVFTLTDTGKRYILRSDFVLSRLNAEYDFFSHAHVQYENAAADQRAAEKESWIDAQLRERGIDWEERWPGRKRVSIDRVTLKAQRINESWQMFVPGTHRGMRISIPASDVVELGEKTLVAFLQSSGQYTDVLGKQMVSGNVLMGYFADKTDLKTTRHPSAEAVQKAAGAEFTPGANIQPPVNVKLSVGQTVFAPDQYVDSLELHAYRIDRAFGDSTGKVWYKLSGEGLPDQLLPEESLGKFMFTDEQQGKLYLSAHGKEAADYADELLARTMGEMDAAKVPIKNYTLTVDQTALISERGEVCRIRIPGKQAEQLLIPLSDVEKLDGKLRITLRSDQSYDVITGAYRYSVSGDGIAKLSGAKEIGEPAVKEKMNLMQENKPAETFGEAKEPPAPSEHVLSFARTDIQSETSAAYRIRLPQNEEQLEAILLPKSAVAEQGDRLRVALDSKQEYSVFRFDGSYRVSRTGDQLGQIFAGSKTVPVGIAAPTSGAANAAQTAAVTVTATASGVSSGAASATATVAAAIPIPEPITMTVKTVCATAAQVSNVALQTGAKLVQSIGKEG